MEDKIDLTEKSNNDKPPKKSFAKIIIVVVIIAFLGAGGYVGWSLFVKGNQKGTQISESRPETKKKKVGIICPLDSFIVNLMDNRGLGKRYLKISMELEVFKEEDKKKIERHTPQLRDTILLLLSSMSFNEINTMEGKLVLKKALLTNINQVLGEPIVQNIYFSEFVVQ